MDQFHRKDFTLLIVPNSGSDKNETETETWPDCLFIHKQIYLHAKTHCPMKIVLLCLLCPDPFLLELLCAFLS